MFLFAWFIWLIATEERSLGSFVGELYAQCGLVKTRKDALLPLCVSVGKQTVNSCDMMTPRQVYWYM